MNKDTQSHTKYYNSSGDQVPSCTTVIKILNKPELIGWANYMGFRRIDVNAFLNKRATYGTSCHTIAESYMSGLVSTKPDVSCSLSQFEYTALLNKLNKLATSFDAANMSIVYTEMELHGNRFGGTLDMLCKNMDTGEYTLFDYKTSKKVYDTHWIQLGGYSMLLEEILGIDVDYVGVILLSKEFEDNNFINIIQRNTNKSNEKIFDKLLDIYWIQRTTKEELKNGKK